MRYAHLQRRPPRVGHRFWGYRKLLHLQIGNHKTHFLPNMAELRAAHTDSRRDGHNCQPNGLAHGLEYASKLNAS